MSGGSVEGAMVLVYATVPACHMGVAGCGDERERESLLYSSTFAHSTLYARSILLSASMPLPTSSHYHSFLYIDTHLSDQILYKQDALWRVISYLSLLSYMARDNLLVI